MGATRGIKISDSVGEGMSAETDGKAGALLSGVVTVTPYPMSLIIGFSGR